MVFYFHTKYARDELKYLVAVNPDYKRYDESEMGEKDVVDHWSLFESDCACRIYKLNANIY